MIDPAHSHLSIVRQCRPGLPDISGYNANRSHSGLDGRTPDEACRLTEQIPAHSSPQQYQATEWRHNPRQGHR